MSTFRLHRPIPGALALLLAACGGSPVPPAPAPSPQPAMPVVARVDTVRVTGPQADIQFMQHMMHHHAQALEMTALVPARTTRDDLRRMAQRIDISQRGEMEYMRRWLAARGASAGALHETMDHAQHAAQGHQPAATITPMPGMLSAADLERLRAASGASFDRLFLEGMIRHHEGALVMVAALFATRGAAQDPELFRFASDVDGDQRAEIARMRQLLATLAP